MSKQHI